MCLELYTTKTAAEKSARGAIAYMKRVNYDFEKSFKIIPMMVIE